MNIQNIPSPYISKWFAGFSASRSRMMNLRLLPVLMLSCFINLAMGGEYRLSSYSRAGELALSGAFTNGVCTVEKALSIAGPWTPERNVFSINDTVQVRLSLSGSNDFFRALAVDLGDPLTGFGNLVDSYSTLTTIAGAGGATKSGVIKWRLGDEGGPATNAYLSRPHIAMADKSGNIFIADKEAHAIRKIKPDGTIVTVAGTGVAGNGTDISAPGIQVALSNPNGLYVRGDGVVYILDMDNSKVRCLNTNGIITTLFTVASGIPVGRGLWVKDDESEAYVACGTVLRKWTPTGGVTDYSTGYNQLGNITMDPQGKLVVTDRGANLVYRLDASGGKSIIAGNGGTSGGGDGQLATATGLYWVRAVCFLPNGGFYVGTDEGSQVWYVDPVGIIHLFLNGSASNTHAGDGTWFYNNSQARVSKIRAITSDYDGNLLITEHDAGYVRKVQFLRHNKN